MAFNTKTGPGLKLCVDIFAYCFWLCAKRISYKVEGLSAVIGELRIAYIINKGALDYFKFSNIIANENSKVRKDFLLPASSLPGSEPSNSDFFNDKFDGRINSLRRCDSLSSLSSCLAKEAELASVGKPAGSPSRSLVM